MEPNNIGIVNTPPSQRPRDTPQGTPTEKPLISTPVPIQIIRTMKGDMALAIKMQNETISSIALAEQKKKLDTQKEKASIAQKVPANTITSAPRPIGRIIIVIGFIIFLVASGFIFKFGAPFLSTIKLPTIKLPSLWTSNAEKGADSKTKNTSTSLIPALIPSQLEKNFTLNQENAKNIFTSLATERAEGVTPGVIKNLIFTENSTEAAGTSKATVISANRLFILVGTPAPEILTRSLEKPFMAGFLGEEGFVATPFLILRVSGYDTGLAGMLAWEKDLTNFFNVLFDANTKTTELVTFRDITVGERDTRVLRDPSRMRIAYTFATPTTIIIAGSPSALEKLVSLINSK